MYENVVEIVLYLGYKMLLLFFILNGFVGFKKTKPRHHSCIFPGARFTFIPESIHRGNHSTRGIIRRRRFDQIRHSVIGRRRQGATISDVCYGWHEPEKMK